MSISVGIDNVVKRYGDMTIISDLSVFIESSGFFTPLGPSGCGKATLLRMIAGFSNIEGGIIRFDDKVISDIPAQKGNIGMVFQSYAIFLHLMVRQNVEYDLEIRKVSKNQMKERVDEILRVVRIDEYQDHPPERLSGGQQQRVVLAGAVVIHPQVLLMDEPLSNLDTKLRTEMRSAIRDVQNQVGITTVYVTYDQEKVLVMSSRVAIMKLGIIQQIGSLRGIYAKLYNAFVSTFTGHSNLFFGTVKERGNVLSVVFANRYHVEMPNLMDAITEGQKVVISVHPEEFPLNPKGMECEIISRTFLGKCTNYFPRFGEDMVLEDQPSIGYSQNLGYMDRVFKVGEKIRPRPDPNKISVFTQDMEQGLIKDAERYDE